MPVITLILLVFGFVLFVLGAVRMANPAPDPPAFKLVAFGLACWILAEILSHAAPLIHGI
jgi:cell division protein FtsW (lipid II flippase)